jgi:group I intron endonuclease
MDMNWFTKVLGYTEVLSGVYRILNLTTGQCYVGSAQDIYHRWRIHYGRLARGEHNPKLQAAWDDPTSVWVFGILELVPKADLLNAENRWLGFYDACSRGYNVASDARAPMRGRKHTPETRESYRQRKASPAQRAALLAHAKAPRSTAHRQSIRKALLGRKFDHLKRPCKDETKKLLSEAHSGKTPWTAVVKAAQMRRAGLIKPTERELQALLDGAKLPKSPEHRRKIAESIRRTKALKKARLLSQSTTSEDSARSGL